jgi:hypothetical protein
MQSCLPRGNFGESVVGDAARFANPMQKITVILTSWYLHERKRAFRITGSPRSFAALSEAYLWGVEMGHFYTALCWCVWSPDFAREIPQKIYTSVQRVS